MLEKLISIQQLYQSIDLSGKLIILEDIERTQIDLLELMGYVNSLVEQDGVKVLLCYAVSGKPSVF